jgi:histidinol-phosphate aminotransferase
MLMHGSAEGLTLAAETFVAGGTIISEWPAYYVVRQRVWQAGGTVVDVPLRADTWQPDYAALKKALRDHPRAGLVHFNVQNNPAGRALERGPFDDFCRHVFRNHPRTVILADESDHEFMRPGPARNIPDFASYVAAGKNLVHLQTFSHVFALTGLRIGYLFAPPRLVRRMTAKRIPRPVNVFGHAAALATLEDHRTQIKRSYALVDQGRDYLYAELSKMGLRYLPSQGQYVMVDTGRNGDTVSAQLWGLGVLTRAGSTWDMDSWNRVCPGQPDENRRYIEALRTVLAQPDPGNVPPNRPLGNRPLGKALELSWRRDRAIRRATGPPRRPYRVTPAAAFMKDGTP